MTKAADRRDRLAAALRANLKRRKAKKPAGTGAAAPNAASGEGASTSSAAKAVSPPHPRQNPAQKDD